jgi:hypothetical protein
VTIRCPESPWDDVGIEQPDEEKSDVELLEYDSATLAQDRACEAHKVHLALHGLAAQTLLEWNRGPARIMARIDKNTQRKFWSFTLGDLLFAGSLVLWLCLR